MAALSFRSIGRAIGVLGAISIAANLCAWWRATLEESWLGLLFFALALASAVPAAGLVLKATPTTTTRIIWAIVSVAIVVASFWVLAIVFLDA